MIVKQVADHGSDPVRVRDHDQGSVPVHVHGHDQGSAHDYDHVRDGDQGSAHDYDHVHEQPEQTPSRTVVTHELMTYSLTTTSVDCK